MDRKTCLDTAANAVLKDRNSTHGEPEDSFGLIARFWSDWLGHDLAPHDVAVMMGLVKVARLKFNASHEDSWVDWAGYAACGAELAPETHSLPKEISADAFKSSEGAGTAEEESDASEVVLWYLSAKKTQPETPSNQK